MNLTSDAKLARMLLYGGSRAERLRPALTAAGTLPATVAALGAVTVASISGRHPYTNDLLGDPGLRPGVVTALLLLLVPALAFLGQCTRIGAVRRDSRLAGLRLAGATPWQVRRIAALESGGAALAGSVAGLAVFLGLWAWAEAAEPANRRLTWPTDIPLPWLPLVAVTLAVPVLAAAATAFALRRVIAEPLTVTRRDVTRPIIQRALLWAAPPVLIVGGFGVAQLAVRDGQRSLVLLATLVIGLIAVGLMLSTGAIALLISRCLAGRTKRPALLIAAARLGQDPWAGARTHGTLLLAAFIGTGFAAMWQNMLVDIHHASYGSSASFYIGGFRLTAVAIGTGLLVTAGGLAVGSAESLLTRRRQLAAQYAAGVPYRVLRRAVLLEALLPVVPAVLLASAAGFAVGTRWTPADDSVPLLRPALATLIVLTAAATAAAATLPLLKRTLHPGELRYE
ncbi:FtsX-like permease family protein [Streptomyces polyrhachis]|uniref:FtsX-like permease family protein n=1 Tax=Streptomyces polyrhachis TaxID=1282885 RepID=A0ABW2GII2_9ACTN